MNTSGLLNPTKVDTELSTFRTFLLGGHLQQRPHDVIKILFFLNVFFVFSLFGSWVFFLFSHALGFHA